MSLGRGWKLTILAAGLGAVGGFAVRTLAYYPLRVTSNSMAPAIVTGDWVAVSTWSPGARRDIERGDIIVFRFPAGSSGRAVKRVVAIAGDQVETSQGAVRVNGKTAAIASSGKDAGVKDAGVPGGEGTGNFLRVPEGSLFILGDNVESSIDSRSLGPLPESEVVGVVLLVIGLP